MVIGLNPKTIIVVLTHKPTNKRQTRNLVEIREGALRKQIHIFSSFIFRISDHILG